MSIQARIPPALCAIHNFISIHDPTEEVIFADGDNEDDGPVGGDDIAPAPAAIEVDIPSVRRDNIAQAMWQDYLTVCMERGIHDEDDDSEGGGSELEEDAQSD